MLTIKQLSKTELLDILSDNKDLIESNSWQEFFDSLPPESRCPLAEFLLLDVKIEIFNYMKYVPEYMFTGSKRISEIELPEGIKYIESEAFRDSSLSRIKLPKSLEEFTASAVFCRSNLLNINLEDTQVEYIPEDTFYGCKNLKQVKLPSRLEEVGDSSFSRSGIEQIYFPSAITYIQDLAFEECSNLKKVEFESTSNLELIGDYAFRDCNSLREVKGLDIKDIETKGIEVSSTAFGYTPVASLFETV